jgi:hypothetical protein
MKFPRITVKQAVKYNWWNVELMIGAIYQYCPPDLEDAPIQYIKMLYNQAVKTNRERQSS